MTKIAVEAGKPIILPDGSVLNPTQNGAPKMSTVEEEDAEDEVDEFLADPFTVKGTQFPRTLADIPNVPVGELKTIMLVLSFNMWGLDEMAIARVLNKFPEDIQAVMSAPLYSELRMQIVEAVRYAETGTVMSYLANQAVTAAKTVVKHMVSRSADVSMAAAKDVLDRAGYRPVDRVEHVHRLGDELRIVRIEEKRTPVIEDI